MKTFIGYRDIARTIPVSLLVALSAGCSVDAGSEGEGADIGVIEEAMGEASCATAVASQTYEGGASMYYVSPRNYSNPACYKAVVLDINNLVVGHPTDAIRVFWNDTQPTTQAECEKQWLGAYIYGRIDGAWEKVDLGTSRGRWSSQNGGCGGPEVRLSNGLVAPGLDDDSFRIVVSARVDQTTGAATRKFITYDMRM